MAGEAARRPGVLLRALCRPAREIPGLCCVSEAGAAARRGPARAPLSRASTHANTHASTHANTHANTPVNSPQLDQWHSPFGSRIGQGPSHLPGGALSTFNQARARTSVSATTITLSSALWLGSSPRRSGRLSACCRAIWRHCQTTSTGVRDHGEHARLRIGH